MFDQLLKLINETTQAIKDRDWPTVMEKSGDLLKLAASVWKGIFGIRFGASPGSAQIQVSADNLAKFQSACNELNASAIEALSGGAAVMKTGPVGASWDWSWIATVLKIIMEFLGKLSSEIKPA